MPSGRIRALRGGCYGSPMGLAGKCVERQQPEPESLREDRGVAARANVASPNSFVDMTEPTV